MALLRHRSDSQSPDTSWSWDDWPDFLIRPWTIVFRTERWMRVEEFTENGTLVVRADLPGIDPDRDVEITLSDRVLKIEAERREEHKTEKRHYMCSELRYGSFARTINVPEGTEESNIDASYRNGVLEVRMPYTERRPAIRVPVAKGEMPARAAS